MRAREEAAQGLGPLLATSRGVGRSPTKARFGAKPRLGMTHRTRSVETWLAAEHRADDAEASKALHDVMRVLPAETPPAGFAGRVMAAATREGVVPAATRRGWTGSRARLLAWCGVGVAVFFGTLVVLGPLLIRQLVRLLNFSVQGFVWIVRGLEGGLDAWSLMAEIGRAVGASLTTPQVSASVVVIELVGVAALYTLHRVLSYDRESTR